MSKVSTPNINKGAKNSAAPRGKLSAWQSAQAMISVHGRDASGHAIQRALEMRESGRRTEELEWLAVFDAIWEIQQALR